MFHCQIFVYFTSLCAGMKIYETNENQIVMEPAVKWAGNPNIVVVIRLMSVEIKIQVTFMSY